MGSREASYKDTPFIQVKNYGGLDQDDSMTGDNKWILNIFEVEPIGFAGETCEKDNSRMLPNVLS